MKKLLLVLAILLSPKAFSVCEINISAGDNLQFDKPIIEIKRSCSEVTINFSHSGKLPANIMGHNWVLSDEADTQGIAQDGLGAGLNNNYIKSGDSRVLAHTNVIGAGESSSVTFSLDNMTDSEYTYFCSFPGHWSVMRGVLKII